MKKITKISQIDLYSKKFYCHIENGNNIFKISHFEYDTEYYVLTSLFGNSYYKIFEKEILKAFPNIYVFDSFYEFIEYYKKNNDKFKFSK